MSIEFFHLWCCNTSSLRVLKKLLNICAAVVAFFNTDPLWALMLRVCIIVVCEYILPTVTSKIINSATQLQHSSVHLQSSCTIPNSFHGLCIKHQADRTQMQTTRQAVRYRRSGDFNKVKTGLLISPSKQTRQRWQEAKVRTQEKGWKWGSRPKKIQEIWRWHSVGQAKAKSNSSEQKIQTWSGEKQAGIKDSDMARLDYKQTGEHNNLAESSWQADIHI